MPKVSARIKLFADFVMIRCAILVLMVFESLNCTNAVITIHQSTTKNVYQLTKRGAVISMASDGLNCRVFIDARFLYLNINGRNVTQLSYKCITIRGGVPFTAYEEKNLEQLIDMFEQKNIKIVDLIAPNKDQTGNELVWYAYTSDPLKYRQEDRDFMLVGNFEGHFKCHLIDGGSGQLSNCGELIDSIKEHEVVGLAHSYNHQHVIVAYIDGNAKQRLYLKQLKLDKILDVPFEFNTTIQSLTYLGHHHLSPLFGVITKNNLLPIYKFDGTELKLTDMRHTSLLTGNRQDMCIDGDIDNLWTVAKLVDFNGTKPIYRHSMFLTRGNNLYQIVDQKIDLQKEGSNEQFEFVADTVFPMRTISFDKNSGRYNNKVESFYVSNDRNRVWNEDMSTNISFGRLFHGYEDERVIASLHLEYDSYTATSKLLFLTDEDNAYEYNVSGVGTFDFEFTKRQFVTSERFDNLWIDFDTSWIDPDKKIVYFFWKDFNIRYEWKDEGIMRRIGEPELNLETFWKCDERISDRNVSKMFEASNITTYKEYKDQIIYQIRYQAINRRKSTTASDQSSTGPPESTHKKRSWPAFAVIIIIFLVFIILCIMIYLILTCRKMRRKDKKPKNSDESISATTNQTVTKSVISTPAKGKSKVVISKSRPGKNKT